MRRPAHALTMFAALLALAGPAVAGEIYCNAQGKDCSDRPSPGSVAMRTRDASATQPAEASEALPSARPAPAADATADERLKAERQKASVQKDVTSSRAEQCKAATERYQKSVEARRMYKMGKDGEREYFTDAQADEARLAAKRDMDDACANGR